MADDRLIAALDVPTRAAAEQLVTRLGDSVSCYKVGMELFYALGGDIVTWLKGREKKVFLDLKLHDIPNTVANGLCSLLRLSPDILNVHTAGGLRMMKTAVEALHAAADREGVPCPKLIGVTVLTSMDAEDWGGLGHTGTIADAVLRRAQLAQKAGLEIRQRPFTMQDVYEADEVFISAATLPLLPVVKADGKPINGGKVGKYVPMLRQMYIDKIKKEAGL